MVLYRTLEYLESHPMLEYPRDYREQLNYVYDNLAEINGFDKYNDFLHDFGKEVKDNEVKARSLEARYGVTKKTEDAYTRIIPDHGYDTLLVRERNGNVYTLVTGKKVDMGKAKLDMADYIAIDESTVSIPHDDKVKVTDKHGDFADINSVEMTAEVDATGEVAFFDSFTMSMSKFMYNGEDGLVKRQ